MSRDVEEQIDEEDSDDEESNHPALGDVPDNSIPALLGHPSVTPHGLTWTHVEFISMDECTAQPKHTAINFPMGMLPDYKNIFYSMCSLFFPYCIMNSCIKSTSERLQKKKKKTGYY